MKSQELMMDLFPDYAAQILAQNLQPYKGAVMLPCRHVVQGCLIITIHDLLHLVYEEESEEKRCYIYRGQLIKPYGE